MPEDARNRFAEDVFGHVITKDGKVLISWQGRTVTTVAGKAAEKLIARLATADRREVQHLLARAPGEMHGELHALGLAARQRRRGLAEPDVAETHVDQRAEVPRDGRHRLEEAHEEEVNQPCREARPGEGCGDNECDDRQVGDHPCGNVALGDSAIEPARIRQ